VWDIHVPVSGVLTHPPFPKHPMPRKKPPAVPGVPATETTRPPTKIAAGPSVSSYRVVRVCRWATKDCRCDSHREMGMADQSATDAATDGQRNGRNDYCSKQYSPGNGARSTDARAFRPPLPRPPLTAFLRLPLTLCVFEFAEFFQSLQSTYT
jgi:hypothetical protein